MSKKFIVGVANVAAYNISTSALLFSSKTLLDSSIEVKTASEMIKGGQGNSLQYIYYHSPEMSVKLTDCQYDLDLIAQNVGSAIVTGKNVWVEESITLVGGVGTITGTPLVTPDNTTADKFGYVTLTSGTKVQVTFAGQNFTPAGATATETVCIRYYALDSAARYATIASNFLPSMVRLVLDCQLASSSETTLAGSSIIGKVQVEIPRFQIAGSQTISMSSSGVSNTPLEGFAVTYNAVGGCTANNGIYGTVTEIIDTANWYDNVALLAVSDNSIALTHPTTSQLQVFAIPNNGDAAFLAPVADLTFASSVVGKATVNASGLISTVAAGDTIVSVVITSKPAVTLAINVTVS